MRVYGVLPKSLKKLLRLGLEPRPLNSAFHTLTIRLSCLLPRDKSGAETEHPKGAKKNAVTVQRWSILTTHKDPWGLSIPLKRWLVAKRMFNDPRKLGGTRGQEGYRIREKKGREAGSLRGGGGSWREIRNRQGFLIYYCLSSSQKYKPSNVLRGFKLNFICKLSPPPPKKK